MTRPIVVRGLGLDEAERHELRVFQVEFGAGAIEELGVLRQRSRPAALDESNSELVQHPRHGQLVGDRVRNPLTLCSVTKRGVVNVKAVVHDGPFYGAGEV